MMGHPGGAQQQEIPPPGKPRGATEAQISPLGPAQQMPPSPAQVASREKPAATMQQSDATAAGSGEPPLQVGAPPVEADIASLPAAASKFGLPPPPNLSSLGSAAATSTQANAPAEAPDQPSLAGLGPPALGRSAPGPSSGPPPGPTALGAGPPSGPRATTVVAARATPPPLRCRGLGVSVSIIMRVSPFAHCSNSLSGAVQRVEPWELPVLRARSAPRRRAGRARARRCSSSGPPPHSQASAQLAAQISGGPTRRRPSSASALPCLPGFRLWDLLRAPASSRRPRSSPRLFSLGNDETFRMSRPRSAKAPTIATPAANVLATVGSDGRRP